MGRIRGLQSGADPSASLQVALQDLQSNSKIAALLPYFVYVVSGVSALGFSFWGGGAQPHAVPPACPPRPHR